MSQPEAKHKAYWNSFYGGRASREVPEVHSPFADWAHSRIPAGLAIAEFGFGTARDSLWFASLGRSVVGYEYAETAVKAAQSHADKEGFDAEFRELNLYDSQSTEWAAITLLRRGGIAIFARFLIHSLEDQGRRNFFDLAAIALSSGGHLYLEFRTGKDAKAEHLFGNDHFRRYLDPAAIEHELEARGAVILYSESSHGLAIYKSEDPHVARIVARWAADHEAG